jgi:hypothetical protein
MSNVVSLAERRNKRPTGQQGWTLNEQVLLYKHVEHVHSRGIGCEMELIRAEGGEPVAIFEFAGDHTKSFTKAGGEIVVLDTEGRLILRAPTLDDVLVHMWWGNDRRAYDAWRTERRAG